MNWTMNQPTTPGFFWLRSLPGANGSPGRKGPKAGPSVVEVYDAGRNRLRVRWPGDEDTEDLHELTEFGELWEWFALELPA